MKHTMRILTFLMLAIVAGTGQTWAEALPDLGYIVCNQTNVIGGTLTFYTDESCENAIDFSGDKSVNLSSGDLYALKDNDVTIGYKVYIKVAPDVAHTLNGYDIDRIRIEKSLGSGSAQAPRRSAQGPETSSLINAACVDEALGIYWFTMPTNCNVTVSATFPEKAKATDVSYIGGTAEEAYVLDGTEFVLGTSTGDTWYVCDDDLEYSHGLTLAGTVHLIVADGYTLTVDGTFGSDGKTLTLYGQEYGNGALTAARYAGNVTIGPGNRFVTNYNSSEKTADGIFSDIVSDLEDINGKTLTPFFGLLLNTSGTSIIVKDKTDTDITIGNTPYYIYDVDNDVDLSYIGEGMVRATATGTGASIANQVLTMGTSDVVITTEPITVEDIPSQNYTGDELTPEITVRIGENILVNGTDYTYEIVGNHIDAGDYEVTITGIGTCFGEVTKTFTISQKATISVEWKDKEDLGDLRPESLTFKLLANGSETGLTVTLNEDNDWRETLNGLTPCNEDDLIDYTWSLVSTPETLNNNYDSDVSQNTGTTGATATFTFTRKTGSLTVRNNVVSDLAADANVDFTFTVTLDDTTIDGEYGGMEFTDGEATVTLKAGESATATNLLYGTTYTVTQTEVEGFTTSPDFTATGTISASSTEAPFTNTRETGSLKVTNTVYSSDNDTDFEFTVALTNAPITDTYGDMMFENGVATVTLKGGGSAEATGLPTTVEYTVTQTANDDFSTTKTGDTGTISATLSEAAFKNIMLTEARFDIDWHDGGNTSNRPEGLTTELLSKLTTDEGEPQPVPEQGAITLNEENNWHASVPNLPMYNEDGTEIAYSWREIESVPSGYLLTDHSTGIDASFTYTLKTSATVKIEWDDANNQDGIRPTEMTATLSDGSEYNKTVTLNSTNSWTATVEDLPKYKVDDREITYTWTQDGTLPEGYTMTNLSKDGIVTTITNSHTPEVTEVKVSKVWDDDDNEEGFRTESVTVHLMKGNEVIESVELDADNEWTHTWSGLAKNDNGTAINYTVTEDEVEHYTTQITKADGSFTYTVRNSRTVEKTQVSVEAIWDDNGNKEGFRPESVTVKLLADGNEANSVTLNEANEWKYTFTGLNKYASGQEIDYTIEQTQLANYKVPVITKTSQTEWAYTVTNSRDYEETNANVTVAWDDSDNEEGFRTESVTVHLKKGNEVIESVELDADNEWTYTWTQLQMYENATAINYTVTEDEVANYTTQITKATDGTFTYTVTNRRTVETTEINVSMVWDDNNDNDRKRPSSVTVKLLANGNEANTATLNEDIEWKYTWTELNKYAGGAEITYTISQEQLDNYKVPVIEKVSETEWEYTVTNNHDLEKTEAMVKVVWVDGNNELHNRPESVTATLLADGTATENTVTMNAENNWTATLTGLQKYSNGEEVDYTWLQGTLPEGYMQTNSAVAEAVTTFTDSYYPDVTVTITGHNNETTYDGTEHIVSGYEAVSSYSLYTDADFFFSGMAQASQKDAGTTYMGLAASQFVNDNANYHGKVTFVIAENGDGYQTITPAPVTVKADDKSKEWGTADDPTLTATVTGMVNDEDASTLIAYTIDRATGTITDGVENSGEYTITPTGDATQGNYAVTYETGKFTIEGKPVTIQDVQGNDVSSVDDAYTITQDQNGVTLTLVVPDETTTPQSVDIPVAVEVNHVVIDRLFESGKAATVYLPFSIEVSKMDGGTFHTFLSVDETTTPLWTVTYSAPLTADAVLQAGTPYIFMPDGSNGGKIVVDNGNEKISICTADQHTDKQGQWEFIGTYDPIVWLSDPTATGYTAERAAEIGLVYGFAAEEKTLDGKDYAVGQFVKVGSGASIDPNRAYLKRIAAQQAPALGEGSQTGMEMPSAMRVVILNADGETGISTWNVERRTWNDDSWYTIDGRKLSGKPSQRGIYINEGRQVVIK